MSAVFALKRNSSTVRYCFEADAQPAVLSRALDLLAKRGLVPARVFAQAADDLAEAAANVLGGVGREAFDLDLDRQKIVGVRQTF